MIPASCYLFASKPLFTQPCCAQIVTNYIASKAALSHSIAAGLAELSTSTTSERHGGGAASLIR